MTFYIVSKRKMNEIFTSFYNTLCAMNNHIHNKTYGPNDEDETNYMDWVNRFAHIKIDLINKWKQIEIELNKMQCVPLPYRETITEGGIREFWIKNPNPRRERGQLFGRVWIKVEPKRENGLSPDSIYPRQYPSIPSRIPLIRGIPSPQNPIHYIPQMPHLYLTYQSQDPMERVLRTGERPYRY